jgi:hypothetical protein
VRTDRSTDRSWAARIPGVRALAAVFERLAQLRVGRVPIGLLALVPVALFIDLFDVGDELVGGPLGVGLSFFVETAFLLGLTGRATYALGAGLFDLLPVFDVVPWATITLVREIVREWSVPEANAMPTGPIIDV